MICLCVFMFSAYNICKYLIEEKVNKEYNNHLMEKAVVEIPSNNKEESNQNTLPISVDFRILKSENQDIVGWIYSEDTPINYPVVQEKDNEYYIDRLINGEINSGSVK